MAVFVASATAGVLPSNYPSAQSPPLPSFVHKTEAPADAIIDVPELRVDPVVPSPHYVPPAAPVLDDNQVPVEPETSESEEAVEPETPESELPVEQDTHETHPSVTDEVPEVELPEVAETAENTLTADAVTPSVQYVPPPASDFH